MADSYLQLYIQIVFAVKFRKAQISEPIRVRVQKFITSVIQARGHKLLAIYCMPDHIHILIGYNPKQLISDLVRDIKVESNKFINEEKLTRSKFAWQNGYGAFSYSQWEYHKIIKYVLHQPEHHRRKRFRSEFISLLRKFDIPFKEEYLFDFFDEH